MPNENRKSKIFRNSIVLYIRLIIVTLIKLWATKILLKNLGAESFGLYNLLAGIIAMLAFLKVAMANASQRFISVSLGKNASTKDVFYTSFVLHFFVGILVLLCIIIGGSFLVEFVLNIPQEQKTTSFIIIALLSFSTFLTILSVPFDSMMVSKENIPTLSIFIIFEALSILLGAYIVGNFSGNRLLLYCVIIVSSSLVLFIIRIGLCRFLYDEVQFHIHRLNDYKIFKGILKYVGWNVVSSLMVILRNQGFAILFNLAGGVVINAAYGIANQVNALFNYCTEAIMQPNRPVIMKSYGAGKITESINNAIFATKVIVLISSIAFLVLFVNMPTILQIWLTNVPDYTVYFCRIIIVATFFVQFSQGSKTLVESTGNVKELFAHIGFFHLATILIGFVIYLLLGSIILAITPLIVEEIICSIYRIHLMGKFLNISSKMFFFRCFAKPLLVNILVFSLIYCIQSFTSHLHLLFISTGIAASFLPLLFYFFIFDTEERQILKKFNLKRNA